MIYIFIILYYYYLIIVLKLLEKWWKSWVSMMHNFKSSKVIPCPCYYLLSQLFALLVTNASIFFHSSCQILICFLCNYPNYEEVLVVLFFDEYACISKCYVQSFVRLLSVALSLFQMSIRYCAIVWKFHLS